MGSHHRLVIRSGVPRTRSKTRVFDSGNSTIHGVTPLTGVEVPGLGTPESFTVVFGVGHGRLAVACGFGQVVRGGWALQAVSGGSFSGRGADEEGREQ